MAAQNTSSQVKHIFLSHSWVTQLVIESIIEKEGILLQDVVIINDSSRKFSYTVNPRLQTQLIDMKRITMIEKYRNFGLNLQMIEYCRWYGKILRFNKWIRNLTNDSPFKLYVPQLHLLNFKLLAGHKNCISFSYLEEGTLSYFSIQEISERLQGRKHSNFFNLLLKFDKSLKRSLSLGSMDNSYAAAYKIMPFAFPGFRNVIDVGSDFKVLVEEASSEFPVENVLILGNYFTEGSFKVIELDEYLARFKVAMEYVKNETKATVYFKHHPSVKMIIRRKLDNILNNLGPGKFEELPDHVCSEFLLAKYRPTTYIFNSTVAVYANSFNCKLVILSKFILDEPDIMTFGSINFRQFYVDPNNDI